MRIGYVLANFSPLSEAFIRREILELCRRGHRVFVYTDRKHYGPRVPEPREPNLLVREIVVSNGPAFLASAAFADGIAHLQGSLMSSAHRATFLAADALHIPFTLRLYSGNDIFSKNDPNLYRVASRHHLCTSIIVEDSFLRDWVIEELDVQPDKIDIVPNSFDLDLNRLRAKRIPNERIVILSIARFVEKKGLIYLIQAFNRLSTTVNNVELWLIGYGPEEARLREIAGSNPDIKFLGPMSEAQTRDAYSTADIFCLPCIRMSTGDADGIPTTVLEAMAFELPIVSTNLLSMPYYVRDGLEGFLVPERDVAALASALERLCNDAGLREEMGKAGRTVVAECCDLGKNVQALEEILLTWRRSIWREKLTKPESQRSSPSGFCDECSTTSGLRPDNRVVSIVHGLPKLPVRLSFTFGDLVTETETQSFITGHPEHLPFTDSSFEAAILSHTLAYVLDADEVLTEVARVVRCGGRLYLHEYCGSPSPAHLNHFSAASLRARVSEHFKYISSRPLPNQSISIIAERV